MSGEIVVVGMGPGPVKYLTGEAREVLLSAKEIYFRYSGHPVYFWLRDQQKDCISFDPLYSAPGITYDEVYRTINKTLVKAAKKFGRVVYALPGNPYVFEKTPLWLKDEIGDDDVKITIVTGLSFIETLYQELEIDPEAGLQIINGFNFGFYGDYPFTEKLGLLLGQVGFPTEKDPSKGDNNAEDIARCLMKKFPPDHKVTLIWSTGMPDYENKKLTFPLKDLPNQSGYVRTLASLYVPPIKPPWQWVDKIKKKKKSKTK